MKKKNRSRYSDPQVNDMVNKSFFDELSQHIARLLPQANELGEEAKSTLSSLLQQSFEKMNLLTREEFAVQSAALARAQERIEALEKEMAKLEAQVESLADSGRGNDDV